jgi:antirestriction protein ArdC
MPACPALRGCPLAGTGDGALASAVESGKRLAPQWGDPAVIPGHQRVHARLSGLPLAVLVYLDADPGGWGHGPQGRGRQLRGVLENPRRRTRPRGRHHAAGDGALLRYYRVWNLEQTRGLKAQPTEAEPDRQRDPIAACEALVTGYPHAPALAEHPSQAFYRPGEDTVHIPRLGRFETAEDYYSTLFHELTHSTGHAARLNRPTLKDALRFGDTNYSKEELVAEMGAAYLCGLAGIENHTIDQSASYLDHWLRRLRRDHRLLVLAAAQAQKAVDHITGQPAGRVAS